MSARRLARLVSALGMVRRSRDRSGSDYVVLDERLRVVEDLQVLRRYEHMLALNQAEGNRCLPRNLDVKERAVEQNDVEPDEPAKRREPLNPRGPGGPSVVIAADLEVVRADVNRGGLSPRKRGIGAGNSGRWRRLVAKEIHSLIVPEPEGPVSRITPSCGR